MSSGSPSQLYAYTEPGDGVGVIDPVTGAITALGPSGLAGLGNGLGHDTRDNLFHANSAFVSLINQVTGAATILTGLVWSPPADNNPRVNAMDYLPGSRSPHVSIQDGNLLALESYLGRLNTATGVVSVIGPTTPGLDAIAWLTTARPP